MTDQKERIANPSPGYRLFSPDAINHQFKRTAAILMTVEILLVEDNELHQELIVRMLELDGYTADVVANGAEALQAVQNKAYELILMDIAMPNIDGFEAIRTIRSRHPIPNPYIIAITALNNPREQCRSAGIDDVLQKPIMLDDFRAALARFHAAHAD